MKWEKWWSGRGSNPRPLHCERSALPAELPPHEEGRDCNEAPPGQQASRLAGTTRHRAYVYRFGPMRIREATAGDLEFIAAANSALSTETEGQDLDQGLLRPGIRAVLDDPTLGRYYLAEIDGRVVGQLMTTYEWSDSRICGIRLYVDRQQ